jgi:UDP-N-acetylmuramoyl-tripeptide--D-alanyl-D-alanine ligase
MKDIEKLYTAYLAHPHVQTDTRKIAEGEIFFALKGPNFNGNNFVKQALDAGASFVVIDEGESLNDPRIFKTENALLALQELALHHRKQLHIPFIAITGSNGKTTTKELIHAVLSAQFRTSTTKGNLNNHIGVPLTILDIRIDAEIAVIEMGANHRTEIASYCRYTLPTHGIITNCGKAHLEGFGGTEGVRQGKGELYDHLRPTGGTAFVMTDYDYLKEMSKGLHHVVSYGTRDAQVTGMVAQSSPFLEVQMTGGTMLNRIPTLLVGDYNLPNVLVAVAVGEYFGVPSEKIHEAIINYVPSNSRSQLVHRGSNRIILDAYNANPSSMRAAIENFARQHDESKIIVIGAMAELGLESVHEHREIVELIRKYNWKDVILVGGDFSKVDHPYRYFSDATLAKDWIKEQNLLEAVILIKGSRSMRMEMVMDAFDE